MTEQSQPRYIKIGTIVHFASEQIGQCQAAIVVGIDPAEGFAHLAIFDASPPHAGQLRWRDYVGPGNGLQMQGNTWHWMDQCPFDHFVS